MLIKGGKVFIGKRFVSADIETSDVIDKIGELSGKADIDASGCYVIPGLVDIHTHGGAGKDFSDGESDLQPLLNYYASYGVTSVLATTMTLPVPTLERAIKSITSFERNGGSKIEGIHLEGPFISYAKRGAQAAENILPPSAEVFNSLNALSGGKIRMVTVAPEEKGGLDFVREISKKCTVSLGHTTASYDVARAAFDGGATHATHLFNAMPPLHHREPGVIGAAFDGGASVELICDGLHIHPCVIRMAFELFGDRVNLVSDSLRCAHMPDGNYELGGQPIVVSGGKATMLDGTLAGSSISLLEGVQRAVKFGIRLERAVYAATTSPAKAASLRCGAIKVGYPADLVVLSSALELKYVIIDGKVFN